MDGLLEILIPLIFAAVYFFGNMVSKSGGDKDASEERRARPAPEPTGEAVDPEEVERQRRVQEEIRRKIMERRQAGGEGGGEVEAGGERSAGRSAPEAEAEAGEARKVPRRGTLAEAGETGGDAVGEPAAEPSNTPSGGFSWESSEDVYGADMRERMRQIEETKRRADRLREQAEASRHETGFSDTARGERKAGAVAFSGPVREQLLQPGAARRAFIYSEILGRPKGLRRQGQEDSPPGLARD